MYYQNYEDYMKSVLGYPIENECTYKRNIINEMQNDSFAYDNRIELEEYYPEIYKLLKPIICEICNKNTMPITKEKVENMVDEVYKKIEANNEIFMKITIQNNNEEMKLENRANNNNKINMPRNSIVVQGARKEKEVENKQKRSNNSLLRDLIKILILNQLLERKFVNRPPYTRQTIQAPFTSQSIPPYRIYEE